MIKNKVNLEMSIIQSNPILSADKSKSFAEFEQKILQIINQCGFQIGFAQMMRLRNFQKLKNIRLSEQIGRLFNNLTFFSKFQNAFFIF